MGCLMFSESYDQQLSDFDFQSVFLKSFVCKFTRLKHPLNALQVYSYYGAYYCRYTEVKTNRWSVGCYQFQFAHIIVGTLRLLPVPICFPDRPDASRVPAQAPSLWNDPSVFKAAQWSLFIIIIVIVSRCVCVWPEIIRGHFSCLVWSCLVRVWSTERNTVPLHSFHPVFLTTATFYFLLQRTLCFMQLYFT